METTNQNNQNNDQKVTAQQILNELVIIDCEGKIETKYTEVRIDLWNEHGNVLVEGGLKDGLVSLTACYWDKTNADGDPYEYQAAAVTAQQVADLINYLTANQPAGYRLDTAYNGNDQQQPETAEPSETPEALTDRIAKILFAQEEVTKKRSEASKAEMQARIAKTATAAAEEKLNKLLQA